MAIPHIESKLIRLRGMIKAACLKDGILRTLVVALAAILFFLTVDLMFVLPFTVRVITGLMVIGATALTAWRYIVRPQQIQLSDDDIALTIEREFPHLNDRLISTVQLVRLTNQLKAQDLGLSAKMIAEVVQETEATAAELDLSNIIKTENLRPLYKGLASAGGVFVVLMLLYGYQDVGKGVRRLLLSNDRYESLRTFLDIAAREDKALAGEKYQIIGAVQGTLPDDVSIRMRPIDATGTAMGNWRSPEQMRLLDQSEGEQRKVDPLANGLLNYFRFRNDTNGQSRFVYDISKVSESFEYYMACGNSCDSNPDRPYKVVKLDHPSLDTVRVAYEPPAYLFPADVKEADRKSPFQATRSLQQVAGTKVLLEMVTNRKVDTAKLTLIKTEGGDPVLMPLALTDNGNQTSMLKGSFTLDAGLRLAQVELECNDFAEANAVKGAKPRYNRATEAIQVSVSDDQPPRIDVHTPGVTEQVTKNFTASITAAAEDDHGLAGAEIRWTVKRLIKDPKAPENAKSEESSTTGVLPINPADFDTGPRKMQSSLACFMHLADLHGPDNSPVTEGDTVIWNVYVWDYKPMPGPDGKMVDKLHGTSSSDHFIRVLTKEEVRHLLEMRKAALLALLEALVKNQNTNLELTQKVEIDINKSGEYNDLQAQDLVSAKSTENKLSNDALTLGEAYAKLEAEYRQSDLGTADELKFLTVVADALKGLSSGEGNKMGELQDDLLKTLNAGTMAQRKTALSESLVVENEVYDTLRALLKMVKDQEAAEELLRLARKILTAQKATIGDMHTTAGGISGQALDTLDKNQKFILSRLSDSERAVMGDMDSLDEKMADRWEKLREVDPFTSGKIGEAIKISKNVNATAANTDVKKPDSNPAIHDQMEAAIDAVTANLQGPAGDDMNRVVKSVGEIIAVLERKKPSDLAETIKKINELERELQRQKEASEQIRQNELNRKTQQELQEQVKQLQQQLSQLHEKQADLNKQTQSPEKKQSEKELAELRKQLEDYKKDLAKVAEEQNKLNEKTGESAGQEQKQLAAALQELQAIKEQQDALTSTTKKLINPAEADLDTMTETLRALKEKQQSLVDATTDALAGSKQDANVAKKAAATNEPDQAKTTAGAGDLNKDLQKYLDANKKAADALPDSPAKDVLNTAMQQVQSAVDAMGKAGQDMQQADDGMKAAAKAEDAADAPGKLVEGGNAQARAMDDINSALSALTNAKNAMAYATKKDRTAVMDKQDTLKERTDDVLSRLDSVASAKPTDPKKAALTKAAELAQGHAAGASSDMEQAGTELVDSHAATASDVQGKASDELAAAIDTIKKALADNGAEKGADAKGLGAPQGDLANRAGDLAQKVGELASKINSMHPDGQQSGANQGNPQGGQPQGGQPQGGQPQGGQPQGGQPQGGQPQGGQPQGGQPQGGQPQGGQPQGGQPQGGQPQGGQPQDGGKQALQNAKGDMNAAKDNLDKAQPTQALAPQDQAMNDLAKAMDQLNNLDQKLKEVEDPNRRLGRKQQELKEAARDIQAKMEDLKKQLGTQNESTQHMDNAANDMQRAQNKLQDSQQSNQPQSGQPQGGQPQGGQPQGGQPQGGQPQGGQPQGGQPQGGQPQGGQPQGGQPQGGQPQGGQPQGGQPQGGQPQGGQPPAGDQNKDAGEDQKQALTELEKAMAELDKLAAAAAQAGDPKAAMAKAAEHQQKVADDLAQVKKQIDEIQKQTQNQNMSKASSATEGAKGKQGKASQSSGGGKSQKSQQEAEESEQDMDDAKAALEEAKKDMQDDQKDEDLLEAERAIAQMILVQKAIYAKTVAMNALKGENEKAGKTPVDRSMRADLLKMAKDQGTLAQTALVVASKMEDTYVFGTVMNDINSDMETAAGELKPEGLGPYVVDVQEDIINKLRQLDEALKKEQQKPKKPKKSGGGSGSGSGSGGGKQPVVPPLAEIKLLKIMENDLRAQTLKLHNELSTKEGKTLSPDDHKRIQRLAQEQGRIKTKTDDLIKKAKSDN